jgi:hypothetical protein
MIEMVEQVKWVICAHGYAMRRYRRRLSRVPPFGRHFQGGPDDSRVPGLKTWAVLFDHFMVKKQASTRAYPYAEFS